MRYLNGEMRSNANRASMARKQSQASLQARFSSRLSIRDAVTHPIAMQNRCVSVVVFRLVPLVARVALLVATAVVG